MDNTLGTFHFDANPTELADHGETVLSLLEDHAEELKESVSALREVMQAAGGISKVVFFTPAIVAMGDSLAGTAKESQREALAGHIQAPEVIMAKMGVRAAWAGGVAAGEVLAEHFGFKAAVEAKPLEAIGTFTHSAAPIEAMAIGGGVAGATVSAAMVIPAMQARSADKSLEASGAQRALRQNDVQLLIDSAVKVPALEQLRQFRAQAKKEGKPETVTLSVEDNGNKLEYLGYGVPMGQSMGLEGSDIQTRAIGEEMHNAAGRYLAQLPPQERQQLIAKLEAAAALKAHGVTGGDPHGHDQKSVPTALIADNHAGRTTGAARG